MLTPQETALLTAIKQLEEIDTAVASLSNTIIAVEVQFNNPEHNFTISNADLLALLEPYIVDMAAVMTDASRAKVITAASMVIPPPAEEQ